MKNIKHYKVVLKTLSPLFIGDGNKINKKEYLYDPELKQYYAVNMAKLFPIIIKNGLAEEYEEHFLSSGNKMSAFKWLKGNNLIEPGVKPEWASYCVNPPKPNITNMRDVKTFIKDPYENPYIPGSSIKGMLRTLILGGLIEDRYQEIKNEWWFEKFRDSDKKTIKNNIRDAGKVINKFSLNNIMKGFQISDSKPIYESLVLCEKIDILSDTKKNKPVNKENQNSNKSDKNNKIPVVMECLPPGIEISFDLNIDEEVFPYKDKLFDFIKSFNKNYSQYFRSHFQETCNQQEGVSNTAYLGGNCGYPSKTVVYPLLLDAAPEIVSLILGGKNREDDKNFGVSPHMLKCTKYKEELYEMGLCSIDFEEQN